MITGENISQLFERCPPMVLGLAVVMITAELPKVCNLGLQLGAEMFLFNADMGTYRKKPYGMTWKTRWEFFRYSLFACSNRRLEGSWQDVDGDY